MHMEISIEIRVTAVINSESVACGRIHQGHEQFSDDPQGRKGTFKCLVAHIQLYSLPVEALNVIVELSV